MNKLIFVLYQLNHHYFLQNNLKIPKNKSDEYIYYTHLYSNYIFNELH